MSGSESLAPLMTIALRDGAEFRVTRADLRVGERVFELARLQDARRLSPEPERIGLRIAGAGLVEFQPAEPGSGALALEAIYRLRPDLRPAGVEPLPLGPEFPPALPPPPPPGMFPYGPPPYGQPPAQMYPPPYGMPPAPGFPPPQGYMPPPRYGYGFMPPPPDAQGRLTPFPRSFGALLGAIFQLFGRHWRLWILLGLITAFIPMAFVGACELVAYLVTGVNPFQSPFSSLTTPPSSTTPPPNPLSGGDLIAIFGIAIGAAILVTILSAWPIATLSVAVRDALLGRPVTVGRALREGLRRLFPVLGSTLLTSIITYAFLAPGFIFYALTLYMLVSTPLSTTSSTTNSSDLARMALFFLLAVLLLLLGGVGALFFSVRLGLAPFAVATRRIGVQESLRQSWRLTRRNFWRVLGITLIMGFVISALSSVLSVVSLVSTAVALLLTQPLAQLVGFVFRAITNVELLYDLRLRHEGYAAVIGEEAPPNAPAPETASAPSSQAPNVPPSMG